MRRGNRAPLFMNIQFYPDELDYVNATLHPLAPKPGRYLELLCHAALRADTENYELIRPALLAAMAKYPPNEERLQMERHDRGVA